MPPDDRPTQDHARGRIRNDLDEPARIIVDQRLRMCRERHLGHPDLAALSERIDFGQADIGDLGLGEDR